MTAFTVKNIPEPLYDRLKRAAELHRRSINSEIITRLERSLGVAPAPREILAKARDLRERIGGAPISHEDLSTAKASGRP